MKPAAGAVLLFALLILRAFDAVLFAADEARLAEGLDDGDAAFLPVLFT